ncbi:DUF2306 domain-containing protein [Maritimibacter alexandrii]|uniref:DUF2306 domain-containing protein n=1 Tax=Maritimibacter alexandrii TaxID=2570355 RepID=UPI00110840BE|nr:DUF2306 domain-containing protein [Maritimibacter alexandrii]
MTRRLLLVFATVLTVSIAFASYRFVGLGLPAAFPDMAVHIDTVRLAFLAHVVAAPIALAAATFQLMPRLRSRRPALHRWTGRVYGVAIVIAAIGALVMAPVSNGGPLASLGFGSLAILWLGTTAIGISRARKRDIAAHRRWMTRSFALTFAAVTLRLELVVLTIAGLTYVEAIEILAWASWVPNLLVAEWLLRRPRRLRVRPATA